MARAHTFPTVMGGLLALALTPAFWPGGATAQEEDNACFDKAANLIARETINVGNVNVCNDDTTLTVTYQPSSGWCLLATNLHVATSVDGVPQSGGGIPKPNQFDYGDDYDCANSATFPGIPIPDDVGVGDPVVIAAEALVLNEDPDSEDELIAWGAGDPPARFTERGPWATYFTYTLQVPSCNQPGVEGASCTVFVTSTLHNGAFGGLAGGDAICNTRADEAGLPGDYKAWLSVDGGASPASRFTKSLVPYKRTDGVTFAHDWDRLVAGEGPVSPLQVDEDGQPHLGGVWTATTQEGFTIRGGAFPDRDCRGWVDVSRLGVIGDMRQTGITWTLASSEECVLEFRLYCFEQ